MSTSHYNFNANNSELSDHTALKPDYARYHLHNMYNEEQFINPHDITGTQGIVKTQMDEIENKKVRLGKYCSIN